MILITGATGLLGSHLLYALVSAGESVRATRRFSSNLEEVKKVFSWYSNSPEDLFQKVEWVETDLMVPESLSDFLEGVDKVYHTAAYVSFDPRERKRIIRDNRKVTENIVNTCLDKGNVRLLHVSSTSALGVSQNGDPVTENMMWTPDKLNSAYSISKFLSEMEIWRGIEEGLDAVIVNPSIILGPGFWHKGSSSLFTKIKKGLKYYTRGVTGFVGAEDVVKSMIALMNSNISSERFIISSENLSYKEVFTMIARELNQRPPHIEAVPLLAGLAWRLDAFRSWFGLPRQITREAVRAGNNKNFFSSEKIKSRTGIEFENISDVIKKVVSKMDK